jgi:hypothetical protein
MLSMLQPEQAQVTQNLAQRWCHHDIARLPNRYARRGQALCAEKWQSATIQLRQGKAFQTESVPEES